MAVLLAGFCLLVLVAAGSHLRWRERLAAVASPAPDWAAGSVRGPWRGGGAALHRAGGGCVPPAPSQAAYEWLQGDPQRARQTLSGASKLTQQLLDEFEAAPWLLPACTPALPYAGVHDLDELLALRARPAGSQNKTVTLLLFSAGWATMAQNSIYSLVKHGGVANYLVVTWTLQDLAACADLNLPCADVTHMLLQPLTAKGEEAQGTPSFNAISWLKPAVVLQALQQGYSVMVADTDVSYTVKPVWDSYLAFIEQAQADGAWQQEGPANTGHFVLLPTPASLSFAAAWSAAAPAMMADNLSEQNSLLYLAEHFASCSTLCMCYSTARNLTRDGRRDDVAVMRSYYPAHFPYTQHTCTIGSQAWVPRVDPCDWTVLYLHAICASGLGVKRGILQTAGFWFLDDEHGCPAQPGSASGVPACLPLQWRTPETEAPHYACPSPGQLALVHGGEPLAVAALQAGGDAAAAVEATFGSYQCW